jgi:hypothetical protein
MGEGSAKVEGLLGPQRVKFYDKIPGLYLKVGAVVAAVWTLVLLIVLTLRSEGIVRVVAVLGGLGGLLTAVSAIVQPTKFPPISRQVAAPVTVSMLVLDLIGTGSWLSWSGYQANRAVDVTAQVHLARNTEVRPGGHAAFGVEIAASRKQIVIMFAVADHNDEIGSCVPNTRLSVTPDTAGNRGVPVTIIPGDQLNLRLPSRARLLHLDIAVQNIRDDNNCAVDIAVSSAQLTNG